MTSHYTRGSVTTLHGFGGVLRRPWDTFFWALTISWSRQLARVWSGPLSTIPACTGKLYKFGLPSPAISISSCKAASGVGRLLLNLIKGNVLEPQLTLNVTCTPSSSITHTHTFSLHNRLIHEVKGLRSDWSTSTYNYQFHVHLKAWQVLGLSSTHCTGSAVPSPTSSRYVGW